MTTPKEFGIFADWKPLTDAGKRWIDKWDPNFIYLGLTDEGTRARGSERPRRAWGAKRSTWERKIAADVKWLELANVEPCFCVWYDFTEKTNSDLLAWFPSMIEKTNVRTVALNLEKSAKESAHRGETDTRLFEELIEMGVRVEIAAYANPVLPIVDTLTKAIPDASGLVSYLPEAYSHYPPNRPDTHWTRAGSWRPGVAQGLAWIKSPSPNRDAKWGEPVMGVGCYFLSGWKVAPKKSFRAMLYGSPARAIAVWSMKWAVRRGRDWVGEELDLWRSGPL